MLGIIRHIKNSWEDYRRLKIQRESDRVKEQQFILHTVLEGDYPPMLASAELGRLPFGFRPDELLVYPFYEVRYRVALASVQREALGTFVRRGDLDDRPESTSGNYLSGRSGHLAVTTARVYFCGDGGGALRFDYDGLVSVMDYGKKRLVITFDDDSHSGDRWLAEFTLDGPDARFASDLLKAMSLWCPKQPEVGFSSSRQ